MSMHARLCAPLTEGGAAVVADLETTVSTLCCHDLSMLCVRVSLLACDLYKEGSDNQIGLIAQKVCMVCACSYCSPRCTIVVLYCSCVLAIRQWYLKLLHQEGSAILTL